MCPVYFQYCFSQKYCILGVFDLADSIHRFIKFRTLRAILTIAILSEYKFRFFPLVPLVIQS